MPQGKPRPDPIPPSRRSLMRRFWRIFRLLALLSIIVAAIAVLLVTRGAGQISVSLIVGTALGVGFTMLLGSSLMALMFLSSRSGADEAAAPHVHQESERE